MRKLLLILVAAACASSAQAITLVDRIVAIVNKEVITYSELREAVGQAERQLARQGTQAPERASPERIAEARKRAESALADARAGSPFARVAASFSDAPDALQGGALGWRSHERLPELFANTLADMKPGDVSDILRSPAGFHI